MIGLIRSVISADITEKVKIYKLMKLIRDIYYGWSHTLPLELIKIVSVKPIYGKL